MDNSQDKGTYRRPFSVPIKPTLRYYEGVDGAAENVVNRRISTQNIYVDNDQDHASDNVERGADLGPQPPASPVTTQDDDY